MTRVATWKDEGEFGPFQILEVQPNEDALLGEPYVPTCLCEAEGKSVADKPGDTCSRCEGRIAYPWMTLAEAEALAAELELDLEVM